MVTNIFTNGTVADATKVNQNFTDIESTTSAGVAQNAYQTIQANNVFQNKDYLAVDEYTVAAGTNTTVNTGSSTATFSTNLYKLGATAPYTSGKTVVCDTGTLTLDGTEKAISIYGDNTLPTGNAPDGTDDTTATSLTLSTSGAVTDKRGLKINPNEDLYVQSVTKNSTSTATTAYIYDTVPTLITSATFSGNTATFGTQVKLTSGINYYLLTDDVGNSYTSVTDSTVTFPLTSAILDITAGVNSTSTEITSEYYNLTSIVTQTHSATSPNATSVSVDIASVELGKSFSVATQDLAARDLFFKSDGLSMYIVGGANNTIYQYTLSTAWDVSTAVYSTKSFSVNAQDTIPEDLFFKSDGLSMYIVGRANNTIYQYTLSTAWDVSTAVYSTKSFNVNAQDSAIYVLFFKSDGLTMFMVGQVSDTIYQYTLSTAWDVSTAVYSTKSFNVTNQTGLPGDLFFKSDGLSMYIIDLFGTIYQYTLSAAWDVSTASYASKSFSVVSQENFPSGLFFKSDGLSMYIVGGVKNIVYQYTLITSWDLSTATFFIDTGTPKPNNILTNNSTGVIDITSLGTGTLKLTYNLATTDTAVTPSTKGWGVFIFK